MSTPTRVLSYARVSGSDPDAARNEQAVDRQARLAEQLARLDAYARSMGWPKPNHFSEIESGGEKYSDASGLTLDDFLSRARGAHRREQRRLLSDLRPGDLILVVKDDRWSRDARFDADVEDYVRARGARWHSMAEPHLWDSPGIVRGITRLTKEQERQIIRERMVGARKRQRDAGEWVEGLVPFGYARAPRRGTRLADRFLHAHGEHAPLVAEAFRRCADGASIEDVAAWLRTLKIPGRKGARQWSKKDVGTMLRSPVYLGRVKNSRGEWIDAHEPIVERAAWNAAQRALDARRLGGAGRGASDDRRSRTADWVLRSIATCRACGLRMGPAYRRKSRKHGGLLFYYVCGGRTRGDGCENGYVRQDAADVHASELALAYLETIREHLVSDRRAARAAADTTAQRKRLMARRGRVIDLFEAGDISGEDRRKRLDAIKAEIDALDEADREAAEQRRAADPAARRALLTELEGLREAWGETTGSERREIIARLAGAITLDAARADRPARIAWRSLDELLRERRRVRG